MSVTICLVELTVGCKSKSRKPTTLSSSKVSIHAVKVYAESYGCSANKFDFELMLGQLGAAGYRLADSPRMADAVIVNTCGVKKPTEDRVVERLRRLSRLGKPLIVAGCLPKINLEAVQKAAPDFAAVLDPRSVHNIVSAVRSAQRGEKNKVFFSERPLAKLEQPKVRLNPVTEIVAISEGCVGSCSFCCVRFARGTLSSFPREMIVERIRQAVCQGVKEVWITSQDNGAYGMDIGTSLDELLEECCRVEGKFMIRVGMMNPSHVLRMLPELIRSFKNEKIFKFLHLPVQSGDDEVLGKMNRMYTADEFKGTIRTFRQEIPEITISTDIICGFPSESPRSFKKTLDLVEETKPDIVNISKFFPRPNTPAENMELIDASTVRNRSRRLAKLARRTSLNRNRRWLGWEGEVLIDEKGRGSSWIGRNFAYKPIVIRSRKNMMGRVLQVKVAEASSTYLEAEIIERLGWSSTFSVQAS